MPPRKKGDPAASKPVSPSRTQASAERRAAGARRSASPSPPPMERVAPDEVDGRDKDNGPGGAAAPKGATMPPPRSGEKSVCNGTGKEPTAGGGNHGVRPSGDPRASKSKTSAHSPSDVQARHDALVAAKALMQFPPSSGDTKVYQEWRTRVERLLDFADGGPWVEPTQAPTVDNPGAAQDKTRDP
jgi:hypothetical protein